MIGSAISDPKVLHIFPSPLLWSSSTAKDFVQNETLSKRVEVAFINIRNVGYDDNPNTNEKKHAKRMIFDTLNTMRVIY